MMLDFTLGHYLIAAALGGTGLGLSAWTLVTRRQRSDAVVYSPRAPQQLIVHGPYRYIRYPGLTAVILLTGAVAVASGAASVVIVSLWVVALCIARALRAERRGDHGVFAEAYRTYRRQTGLLIPRVSLEIGRLWRPIAW